MDFNKNFHTLLVLNFFYTLPQKGANQVKVKILIKNGGSRNAVVKITLQGEMKKVGRMLVGDYDSVIAFPLPFFIGTKNFFVFTCNVLHQVCTPLIMSRSLIIFSCSYHRM